MIRELLAAVDKGNVTDVKQILEDPNAEVNGTNKVCLSMSHCVSTHEPIRIFRVIIDNSPLFVTVTIVNTCMLCTKTHYPKWPQLKNPIMQESFKYAFKHSILFK